MGEIIKPKKEKKINIINKDIKAPDLPSILEYEFKTNCALILKKHLENKGIVIPSPVLETLSSAYKEIGQLYWILINKMK